MARHQRKRTREKHVLNEKEGFEHIDKIDPEVLERLHTEAQQDQATDHEQGEQ